MSDVMLCSHKMPNTINCIMQIGVFTH